MLRSLTLSLCIALVLSACSSSSESTSEDSAISEPGSSSESVSADISLFNGKNLDGWTIYGTEEWYVEDGNLISESGPDAQYGYLATDEYYDDFELTLQFKQESNGNSGVFIRSTVEGTKVSGWQVEVAPKGSNTGGVYESYGRGWLIQPEGKGDVIEGEWNTMKIRAVGPELTSWLNGEEMITITDELIGEGKGSIALQIHDGGGIKVRWREIVLSTISSGK